MDQSSDIPNTKDVNPDEERGEKDALDKFSEVKTSVKDLPTREYSGHSELFCLKKELLGSTASKVQPKEITLKECNSQLKVGCNIIFEANNRTDYYKTPFVENENSMQESRCSETSASDALVEHYPKTKEIKDEDKRSSDEDNNLLTVGPVLFDGTMKLRNSKNEKEDYKGAGKTPMLVSDAYSASMVVDLPGCEFSGDKELMSLKEELVDLVVKEKSSSSNTTEANFTVGLDVKHEIEDEEMATGDNESSSEVSNCPEVNSDSSNTSVHALANKKDVNIEKEKSFNQIITSKTVPLTFDGTIKLENMKIEIDGATRRNENSGASVDSVKFEKDEGVKAEKDENYPIVPFKGKIKLRESNPHEFIVPFIGKKIEWGDEKPTPAHKEFAIRNNLENRKRYSEGSTRTIRQHQARTKEEVDSDDQRVELRAHRLAVYILKTCERILLQMQSDEPNEDKIIKYFVRFLKLPASPLTMIHVPQFVHTVLYVRGSTQFSRTVRDVADMCYAKIHVMFPIPAGYNFATVYTNQVAKCLPEGCDGMYDYLMVYDSGPESEAEDSAFSDTNDN